MMPESEYEASSVRSLLTGSNIFDHRVHCIEYVRAQLLW
jgi:hypothetical protein